MKKKKDGIGNTVFLQLKTDEVPYAWLIAMKSNAA